MKLSELGFKNNLDAKNVFDGDFDCLSFADKTNNCICNIERALTYVSNIRYLEIALSNPQVSCVIAPSNVFNELVDFQGKGIILSEYPRFCFFSIHNQLAKETNFYCVEKVESRIDKTTIIEPNSTINDYNVFIKENCILGPNSTIYDNVYIDYNTVIHSNCVIGSQGFYTAKNENELINVIHTGSVVIGKSVNIQSGTIIDKEVLGRSTKISDNVVIGGRVHIGHGAQIGRNSCISTGSIIGGYANIGENVYIGPGSIISNRVTIQDNAYVSLGSVVIRNVKKGQKVSGNFAIDHEKHLKHVFESSR